MRSQSVTPIAAYFALALNACTAQPTQLAQNYTVHVIPDPQPDYDTTLRFCHNLITGNGTIPLPLSNGHYPRDAQLGDAIYACSFKGPLQYDVYSDRFSRDCTVAWTKGDQGAYEDEVVNCYREELR